jgi:hypothetical protein
MVSWPTFARLAAAPSLYLPDGQDAAEARVALVFKGASPGATAALPAALPAAWTAAGATSCIAFFRPRTRSDAEWRAVAATVQSAPPRSISWLDADDGIAQAIDTDGLHIVAHRLFASASVGLQLQNGAARLDWSASEPLLYFTGTGSLIVEGASVPLAQRTGWSGIAGLAFAPQEAGRLKVALDADAPALDTLHADCRYFVRGDKKPVGNNRRVDRFSYPLLALRDGETTRFAGQLDFLAKEEWVRLGLEDIGRALRLHLKTTGGDDVFAIPSPGAGFVITPWPETAGTGGLAGSKSYFRPDGGFTLVRPDPAAITEDEQKRKPYRILTGGAGTEYVEFDAAADPREPWELVFVLGGAYIPSPPWEVKGGHPGGTSASLADADDKQLREDAHTGWMLFGAASGVRYYSQSQRAPLFEPRADTSLRGDDAGLPVFAHRPVMVTSGERLTLPVTPVAGVPRPGAPFAPGAADAGTPARDPLVLASSRIAPARVEKGKEGPALLGAAFGEAADASAATPQGFQVGINGRDWKTLRLATSWRLGDVTPRQLLLDLGGDIGKGLAAELLNPDLLLAVSRVDASPGALAIEHWGFGLNLGEGGAAPFDKYGGVLVFKFHSGTLLDALRDPRTYQRRFNTDALRVHDQMKEFVNKALGGDAYWQSFREILHDPRWTGVVAFNAVIGESPLALKGLLAGMPETLRAEYLAIPINRVDATNTAQRASVSGLIDFTGDPPEPLPEPDDGPEKPAYSMSVTRLRVLFADNAVQRFECELKLRVKKLFFEPVRQDLSDDPDIVVFKGHYEAHGTQGGPTYTFGSETPVHFLTRKPPTGSKPSILKSVELRRMRFVTESTEADAGGQTRIRSRFTLRGSLAFNDVKALEVADLFSLDALDFDNLALEVETTLQAGKTGGGKHRLRFHAGALTPEVSIAPPRPGSFLAKLPVRLKGFIARVTDPASGDKEDIWTPRGFFPIAAGSTASPSFALIFSFDLGSLGALVQSAQGLQIDVALGWARNAPVIALRLPEVNGGEFAFGVEGIMRLLVRNFEFKPVGQSIVLVMKDAKLEVLGKQYPPETEIGGMLIAGPKHSPAAWLTTAKWKTDGEDQFLAVGQRLRFEPRQGNTQAVVGELMTLFSGFQFGAEEAPPPGAADVLKDGGAADKLRYSARNDWIIGVRQKTKKFGKLGLDLVLNDPTLYGVHLSYEGMDILDLQYRKVADGLGMFYIEAPLAFAALSFAPMQVSLPTIAISVFTDGGFRLDLGFPTAMDFSRSFHVEMPPYVGAGGFYLAKVSGLVGDLLPQDPTYAAVFQAGLGFKVGYGKSLKVGPFSAAASICVFASLEGALGYRAGKYLSPDIAVRGRIGVIAELSCHLDLVLTALNFSLALWVALEVTVVIVKGELRPVTVTLEVGVRVRIRWVVARFKVFGKKIEIAVYLSFNRVIRLSTTLGGDTSASDLAPPLFLAALQDGSDAWAGTVAGGGAKEPLTLHFLLEAAIGRGHAALAVAQLALERSPTAGGDGATDPGTYRGFDRLLRAALRWAARARVAAGKPATTYTRADVEAWSEELSSTRTLAEGGLTYPVLLRFLAANFDVFFAGEPADGTRVTLVPAFPELQLELGGRTSRFDQTAYTAEDQRRLDELLRDREARDEADRLGASAALGDAAAAPLSALLLQEYVDGMIKAGVHDLRFAADGERRSLDELMERLRDPAKRPAGSPLGKEDGFAQIAATLASLTQHGVHVPPPAAGEPGTPWQPSLYERAGQAMVLYREVPAAFPGDLAVRLSTFGEWPLGPVRVDAKMDAQGFGELRKLDALMRAPGTRPALGPGSLRLAPATQARRQSYALSTPSELAAEGARLFRFPPSLVATFARRAAEWPDAPARWPMPLQVVRAPEKSENTVEDVPGCTVAMRIDLQVRRRDPAAPMVDLLGADDVTRRLIERYLRRSAGAAATRLTLYRWSAAAGSKSPDERLEPLPGGGGKPVLCVMTNLSRRANPEQSFAGDAAPDAISARLDQPDDFLTLVWKSSIVRDGGFTLVLPAPLAASAWDANGRGTLTLLVELGAAGETAVPAYANAVRIPRGASDGQGHSLLFVGDAADPFGTTHLPVAKPGILALELLRPNPERQHRALDALGIPAGLPGADAAEAEALLDEAGDLAVHLHLTYRLLTLRLAGDQSEAAPYRRPSSPRDLTPREFAPRVASDVADAGDEDDLPPADRAALPRKLPDGIEVGDWAYRRSLDLRTLFAGKQGPYDLVGQTLTLQLGLRDGYGNDSPWGWEEKVPVRYADRIVPAAEWPRVRAAWEPGADARAPVTLTLAYDPSVRAVESDLVRDAAAEVTEHELRLWERIADQVNDPRMRIACGVSLLRDGVPLGEGDLKRLRDFVKAVRGNPAVPASFTLSVAAGAATGAFRTRLEVSLDFERDAALVDPEAGERVPEVARVRTLAGAAVQGAAGEGLRVFAARFAAAFPGHRLALGDRSAEESTGRSLWAVRRELLRPRVERAADMPQWARIFAPRPVTRELVTVENAPLEVFGETPIVAPLRGLEPDALLRRFLGDLEGALRPEVFSIARQAASGATGAILDGIVRDKRAIAEALKALAHPMFEKQGDEGVEEARAELADALRRDVRQAYATDAIVQLLLTTAAVPEPLLLYGDVVPVDPASGLPVQRADLGISRGRAWICPGTTRSTLTLLIDRTTNPSAQDPSAPPQPSELPAALGFRVTHVAHPENGACGESAEYERMEWLQLVPTEAAATKADYIPLEPGKEPVDPRTLLRIPLPARAHPQAPVLLAQQGTPASSKPADLGEARQWTYGVRYSQEWSFRRFDRVVGKVRFERYAATSAGPRAAFDDRLAPLASLVTWLVAWERSSGRVLAPIDALTKAPPAGDDAPVFKAYRYLANVAARVAEVLPGAIAEGLTRSSPEADAAGLAYTVEIKEGEAPAERPEVTPDDRSFRVTQQVDGTKVVSRELAAGGATKWLDILDVTAATAELRIERNRALLGAEEWRSAEAFVYTTQPVAFGNWAQPVLEPEALLRAATVKAGGAERLAGLTAAFQAWLRSLTDAGAVDMSVRCSYGFDPRGGAPSQIEHLGQLTLVPICFVPSGVVDAATCAATALRLAQVIDDTLPTVVHADGAGVHVEVTVFTHGPTAERPVLRVRGLWIPIVAVPQPEP